MPDTREEILARLVAIGTQVPGIAVVGRNRVALSETARPAVIVLDADEPAEPSKPGKPLSALAALRQERRRGRASWAGERA